MTSLYKIVCMYKCCVHRWGEKKWGKLIWLSTPLGYSEDLQDIVLLNSDLGNIYGVFHKSCRWWGPRLSAPMWNLFSFHIQLRKLTILTERRNVTNTTNTNTRALTVSAQNVTCKSSNYFPAAINPDGVRARSMSGICLDMLIRAGIAQSV